MLTAEPGRELLVFFFFKKKNLAIDSKLFPMDELLLKIDVPVEAALLRDSSFVTILF